jgi:hypothetical protein
MRIERGAKTRSKTTAKTEFKLPAKFAAIDQKLSDIRADNADLVLMSAILIDILRT